MQAPEPDAKPLTATTTSQAVTPMDEQHTIYSYSGWEDNAIIEAQQRVITRTPQPHMLGIRADHALNEFRRLMDELIAAEHGGSAADPVPLPLAAEG